MAKVYVAVEGFLLKGRYIAKELSFVYDDDRMDHFRFAAPHDLFLNPAESITIRYVSKHINGLSLHDTGIDYGQIGNILSQLSGKYSFSPNFPTLTSTP